MQLTATALREGIAHVAASGAGLARLRDEPELGAEAFAALVGTEGRNAVTALVTAPGEGASLLRESWIGARNGRAELVHALAGAPQAQAGPLELAVGHADAAVELFDQAIAGGGRGFTPARLADAVTPHLEGAARAAGEVHLEPVREVRAWGSF